MAPNRRQSYTNEFKLMALEYANKHGNRPAARFFHINESSIRQWKKQKTLLTVRNPKKRCERYCPPKWPRLEENLRVWILSDQNAKQTVSTILKMARIFAKKMKIENFNGSSNWVYKFRKRNKLLVKPPKNLNSTIQSIPTK